MEQEYIMKRFLISLLSAIGEAAIFELLDFLIFNEAFDPIEYAVEAIVFFVINIIFYKWLFKKK